MGYDDRVRIPVDCDRSPQAARPAERAVLAALCDLPAVPAPRLDVPPESEDDAALALWVLHELSYLGFEGVDDGAERDPELVRVR